MSTNRLSQNNNVNIEQQIAELDSRPQEELSGKRSTKISDKQRREFEFESEFEVEVEDNKRSEEDSKSENVKVMVRCRPPNRPSTSSSSRAYQENCVVVDESEKSVEVDGRQFHYDAAFGADSSNERVYMKSARQLIDFAFQGYNCTVFLYGQTGTGKTYTHSSISLSSFAHIFTLIRDSNTQSRFLIRASYYELYNEDIRDLLVSILRENVTID